ncbi:hypothetical protein BC940DRAFT_293493 [Gongronella butleri]|nr:hypothetical protein BC940DRAFT_293493 [Gongronella butleri]
MPSDAELLDEFERLSAAARQPQQARPPVMRYSGPRPPAFGTGMRPPRPYMAAAAPYTPSPRPFRPQHRSLVLNNTQPSPPRPYMRPGNKSLVLNYSVSPKIAKTAPEAISTPSTVSAPAAKQPVLAYSGRGAAVRPPFPSSSTSFRPSTHAMRPPRPIPRTNTWTRPGTTAGAAPTQHKSQHKKLVIRRQADGAAIETKNHAGQTIVTIHGVPYLSKGKKLIRQDTANTATLQAAPRVLIRRIVKRRDHNQNMVLGQAPGAAGKKRKVVVPRSNKSGQFSNMVLHRQPDGYERQGKNSLVLTAHKTKDGARKPCRHFTRHGVCPQQLRGRCAFVHDRAHRAICPRFLLAANKCPTPEAQCRLAHSLDAKIVPHCVHFQSNRCRRDNCPFAHVHLRNDASLCRAFALDGFCAQGLACKSRHVLVCPTLAAIGKCTKPKCKWPHVGLNSKTPSTSTTDTKSSNAPAPKKLKTTTWVRPEIAAQRQQEMQEKRQKRAMPTSDQPLAAPDAGTDKPDDGEGFLRFDDVDTEDDEMWNQYLIKDADDLESIAQLRFDDDDDNEKEDQDDDRDDNGHEQEPSDDEVYEEIDENEENDHDGDVEEIYEEISDDSDSDTDQGMDDLTTDPYSHTFDPL